MVSSDDRELTLRLAEVTAQALPVEKTAKARKKALSKPADKPISARAKKKTSSRSTRKKI